MPPEPLEYQGHAVIAEFFQTRSRGQAVQQTRWSARSRRDEALVA